MGFDWSTPDTLGIRSVGADPPMTGENNGTSRLTYPRLLGVRVEHAAPIKDVFFGLTPGLTVIYGRNGAGKTRLLESLAYSIIGGDLPCTSTLVFEWPPSSDTEAGWLELNRWRSLPGNPWATGDVSGTEFMTHDAREAFEVWGSGRLPPVSPEKARERLWQSVHSAGSIREDDPTEAEAEYMAMRLLLQAEPWRLLGLTQPNPDEENVEILRLNSCAALDIARMARFAIRRNCDVRGSESELLILAHIDESTPSLRALAERLIEGEESGGWTEADLYWPLVELALESDLGQLIARAHSIADRELGRPPTPVWFGDTYLSQTHDGPGPAVLIRERLDQDLAVHTVHYLERQLHPPEPPSTYFEYLRPTQRQRWERSSSLLRTTRDGFDVNPDAVEALAEVSERASNYFNLLLEQAPLLEARIHPIPLWPLEGVLSWAAIDPTGIEVEIEQLSNAQARWARFAIQLATLEHSELPIVCLLDEPEAALHRRAERHLVAGLTRLSDELNAYIIAATHSPAFLEADTARLVHVHRGAEGATEIEAMDHDLRSRIDELGIDVVDLLQFCRTAVLVEGEHELIIFDELFRDEFAAAGAELFAMRGASNLKNASDAQLLFRYTDARLVVVLDNEDAGRVQDIWERACGADERGEDYFRILDEFTKGAWKAEAKFLSEYCSLAIKMKARDRISFFTLSEPDIPEYLPVGPIVRGLKQPQSWHQLRESFEAATSNSKKKIDFKTWMKNQHGARYDENTLRAAVRELDHIPDEFSRLLNFISIPHRAVRTGPATPGGI